jgi:hypothetical protein
MRNGSMAGHYTLKQVDIHLSICQKLKGFSSLKRSYCQKLQVPACNGPQRSKNIIEDDIFILIKKNSLIFKGLFKHSQHFVSSMPL